MRHWLIIFCLLITLPGFARGQFDVGLRDSRFIYGQYTLGNHYFGRLEQSVFSEAIANQYLRGYVGYVARPDKWELKASGYFGSTYNRSYHSEGALLIARFSPWKRLWIKGVLNPHHDSGIGYNTCYEAVAGVSIVKAIDLLAGYSTIPEYRQSEKRAHVGFDFHVGHLNVSPVLSLATTGGSKANRLRLLVNFNYQF